MMRPGRLDRLIFVGPPDSQGREEILRIRMRNMSIGPDVLERSAELAAAVICRRLGRIIHVLTAV
jgi:ATP-dependent 26S proteasome regulatory subunit